MAPTGIDTGGFAGAVDNLATWAAKARQSAAAVTAASRAAIGGQGSDPDGVVTAAVGPDGRLCGIAIADTWSGTIGRAGLGPAVLAALAGATRDRMSRWARAMSTVDRSADAPAPPDLPPPQADLRAISSPAVMASVVALADLVLSALDERADQVLSALDERGSQVTTGVTAIAPAGPGTGAGPAGPTSDAARGGPATGAVRVNGGEVQVTVDAGQVVAVAVEVDPRPGHAAPLARAILSAATDAYQAWDRRPGAFQVGPAARALLDCMADPDALLASLGLATGPTAGPATPVRAGSAAGGR